MKKVVGAILCTAILATAQMQAVPSFFKTKPTPQPRLTLATRGRQATQLMRIVGTRALAHMQSRAGIATGMLALQGATAAMLLKELCSAELPITVDYDDVSSIKINFRQRTMAVFCFLAAIFYPKTLGIPMPKNGGGAEKTKWLARLQSATAKIDAGSAVNAFLLSAIQVRLMVSFVQQVDNAFRAAHRATYDYAITNVQSSLCPVVVPDEDGLCDAYEIPPTNVYEILPTCCICYENTNMSGNELCNCCDNHEHIVHRKCFEEEYTHSRRCPGGGTDCILLGERIKRTWFEKFSKHWTNQPVIPSIGIGMVLASTSYAFYGASKARSAYRASRS